MSESPVAAPVLAELDRACDLLDAALVLDPDAVTAPGLQLVVQNAVAGGVAWLERQPTPTASDEVPTRSILASDLLITADLVRRALAAEVQGLPADLRPAR